MPKIRIKDIDIYYEAYGKGHPLVLVAGHACDVNTWWLLPQTLASHYQVVLFDNRGAGRTSAPDTAYTIEQMASDTIGLIDALKLGPCHFIGHSMGGTIVQQIALQAPEKVSRLVLVNTSEKYSSIGYRALSAVLHLLENEVDAHLLAEAIFPWLYSEEFLASDADVQDAIRQAVENPFPQSIAGKKGQLKALLGADLSHKIDKIDKPALIIAGEKDLLTPVTDAARIHKKIRNSKLTIFKGMGHLVMLEKAKEFLHEVLAFLKED